MKEFVQTCPKCQGRKKPIPTPKPPLQPITAVSPFHMWGTDIMELPLSYDGNKYLLVFTDYLTKWVEAFPMPDQRADRVASLFLTQIVCRFGAPAKLLSDAAPNFLSKVVAEVLRICKTQKVTTTPYAPQTDGLVERMNRTLQGMLATYVEQSQRDWDAQLPFILFAVRTSQQASTQESPYYLMFGQDPVLPIDLAFQYTSSPYIEVEDLTYVEQVQQRLTLAWATARTALGKAQRKQKEYHDQKATQVAYNIGDKVLLKRTDTYIGRAAKLGSPWAGPYLVTAVEDNNNVKLTELHARMGPPTDPFRVHVRRVKKYFSRDDA